MATVVEAKVIEAGVAEAGVAEVGAVEAGAVVAPHQIILPLQNLGMADWESAASSVELLAAFVASLAAMAQVVATTVQATCLFPCQFAFGRRFAVQKSLVVDQWMRNCSCPSWVAESFPELGSESVGQPTIAVQASYQPILLRSVLLQPIQVARQCRRTPKC